ncbi:MAG: hypothetical protein ACRCWI_06145 [Brevinema sp.]
MTVLILGACTEDSRELTRTNIERWIKKDKLHKYIDETYFTDTLKELLTLLTEEERSIYADYISKKEQELRFPRPTPMMIEYLDSITNQSVMDEVKKYRDEVDLSLKDMAINDRLEIVSEHVWSDELPISIIYYDRINDRYYHGALSITNIDPKIIDTNKIVEEKNIALWEKSSEPLNRNLKYLTNLSLHERLYVHKKTGTIILSSLTNVYHSLYIPLNWKIVLYDFSLLTNTVLCKDTIEFFQLQDTGGNLYPELPTSKDDFLKKYVHISEDFEQLIRAVLIYKLYGISISTPKIEKINVSESVWNID